MPAVKPRKTKARRSKKRITNRTVLAAARKRYRGRREFSTTIKGIRCPHCHSRDTATEFYRYPGDRAPRLGVTGCNSCGAD